ncbi:MAG: hypothetical protein DRJ03_03585 [Chloroflexi bacterium]|nr:MAG: hypothetical protein DRJ03_03585 [Chloroflexota bacterium]
MKFNFELTERQSLALEYLLDAVTRYILYGGAKGGGKSYLLCLWVFMWCKMLCKLFGLKPREHPIPLGFIGRKQATDFKKTTLETWKKIIPPTAYEIKKQDSEIILFGGRCKIFYGGLDSSETINKFNSAELAFFALDQAEEVSREEVGVLRGSLRLTYKGIKPAYKELYTANPADCWLKSDWVDVEQAKYAYIPALPTDNPHLPEDYIATLQEAFKYNDVLQRAYIHGDWTGLKDNNTLINPEMIEALRKVNMHFPHKKRLISCDPATSHDECVFKLFENYKVLEQKILARPDDEMKVAAELAAFMETTQTYDLVIDEIGLGGGIASGVQKIDEYYRIIRFNSASKSMEPEKYANCRAEAYWYTMQQIHDKVCSYIEDEETRRQLYAVKFKIKNGRIIMVEKDEVKKNIGRSPDRADAYVMGVWAHDHVEAWKPKRASKRYNFEYDEEDEYNPATV